MNEVRAGRETSGETERERWARFEDRFGLVWTAVMYVLAAVSVYSLYLERPHLLRGLPLLGLAALLGAYFALYHLVLLRSEDDVPLRTAALYGAAQLALVALLQWRYEEDFGNLGLALVGHLMAVLSPRLWAVAVVAVLSGVAVGWRVPQGMLRGEWDNVLFFAFQMAMWTVALSYIFGTLRHRLQLAELVDQLRRAKGELERSAAQAEELAALRERTRLAREMHDSLGHALVVVNVKLEAAERLYARDPARGAAELEDTRALVREAMAELRRSLRDLRSTAPGGRELAAALCATAEELGERAGIRVFCEVSPELPPLAPERSEALWRVAREALSNIERHAGAATARVQLAIRDGWATLRVEDDGSGLGPRDLDRPGRYGVIGMRERVEALGGALSVRARPGGGAVVEARVPLDGPADGALPGDAQVAPPETLAAGPSDAPAPVAAQLPAEGGRRL